MLGRIRRRSSDQEDFFILEEAENKLLSFSANIDGRIDYRCDHDINSTDSDESDNDSQDNKGNISLAHANQAVTSDMNLDYSFMFDNKLLAKMWYNRQDISFPQSIHDSLPVAYGSDPIDKFCRKMALKPQKSHSSINLPPEYFDEKSDPFLIYLCADEGDGEIEMLSYLEKEIKVIERESYDLLNSNAKLMFDFLNTSGVISLNINHAHILVKNKLMRISDIKQTCERQKLLEMNRCVVLRDHLNDLDFMLRQIQRCFEYEEDVRKSICAQQYDNSVVICSSFKSYLFENLPSISIDCLKGLIERTHNLQDFVINELCGEIVSNIQSTQRYQQILEACQRISPNHPHIALSIQIGISCLFLRLTSTLDEFMVEKMIAAILQCIELYKQIIGLSSKYKVIVEGIKFHFRTFWSYCLSMMDALIVPVHQLILLQESLHRNDNGEDLVSSTEIDQLLKQNAVKYLSYIEETFLYFLELEDFSIINNHIPRSLECVFEQIEYYRKYIETFPEFVIEHLTLFVDIYMLLVFRLCCGTEENEDILVGKLRITSTMVPTYINNGRRHGGTNGVLSDTKSITNICFQEGLNTDVTIKYIDNARKRWRQFLNKHPSSLKLSNGKVSKNAGEILNVRWHATDSLSLLANFLSNLSSSSFEVSIRILHYLSAQCEKISALRSIAPVRILSGICNTNWNTQIMHDKPSEYVHEMLIRFQHFLNREVGECSRDKVNNVWIQMVYDTLLDGYAQITLCSIQGRSLMALDIMYLRDQLQEQCKITVPDDVHGCIERYIKAYYLPLEDRLEFVKDHLGDYKLSYAIGLLRLSCDSNEQKVEICVKRANELYQAKYNKNKPM